ncbi:MAG TPA: hypothetical protein PLJ35_09020 [Anaerolineae bacterium]|nr:hypothetical protein [Anaerolineae bacterium]HOQ98950.1 hypothetical protein [Anaerolineae bacterium]HPL30028.1 hypothetical protein [Anaerolineae bacterium]
MPHRGNGAEYPELVHHVVRDARRPLTIAEIVAGMQRLEPIHAANPRALVQRIVEQSNLIVPLGGAHYGYLPHLLEGNRFRQPLPEETQVQGFIELSPELMTALWPGWVEAQRKQETRPATLLLPGGVQARLQRHFRLMGRWGLTAGPDLWRWLDEVGAQPGDDLLIGVADVEARNYVGDLQCRLRRDEQAIAQRNHQVADHAEQAIRAAGGEILVDRLAPLLIAAGVYAEPIAPDPLLAILAEDGRFVDAGLGTVALLEGWTAEDERLAEMRQQALRDLAGDVRPRFGRAGAAEAPRGEAGSSFAQLIVDGRYEEAVAWLERENRIHTDETGQVTVDLHGLLDDT